MAMYIYEKTYKQSTYEDYQFWQMFISSYSIKELDIFFSQNDVFFNAFLKTTYSYGTKQLNLNIIRTFLTKEEQFALICQLENYIFIYQTEFYVQFLIEMLSDENIRTTFPEECRELFLILETYTDVYNVNSLRKYFYTTQELETYANKKAEEKIKQEKLKKENKIKELNNALEEISKSENKMDEIYKFFKTYYITDNFALTMGANFLLAELEKERNKISPKILYGITDKLLTGYHYDNITWSLFQSIVTRMEELQNEEKSRII